MSGPKGRGDRRLIVTLVLLASAFLAFVPVHVAAGHGTASRQTAAAVLARVRYIQHGLSVQAPHKRAVKGKVKMALYSAYTLRTAKQQEASIGFHDGTVLHINQLTDAILRNPHLTYVGSGEVEEILMPGTNHRVQTATAVAAAIGTRFVVQESKVNSRVMVKGHAQTKRVQQTLFIVVEGALQVKNAAGSVVVKTGQKTAVVQGKAPQPPTPANATAAITWTKNIPPPAVDEENIALDANGGSVAAYSSRAAGDWAASNINDGRLDKGWMSGVGHVSDQWVKLGFRNGNTFTVSGVIIDPAATGGSAPADALHHFQIRVSTSSLADSDFATVYTGAARDQNVLQTFTFSSPVRARYLELYAADNYGGKDGIAVSELEVVGVLSPVVFPTPTPSLIPTASSTPTATATSTWTPTPPATPTSTVVPTMTATTATTMPTPTSTPAFLTITLPTALATNTPFPTLPPTLTPTPLPTATPTNTPLPTPTFTPTPTPTFIIP